MNPDRQARLDQAANQALDQALDGIGAALAAERIKAFRCVVVLQVDGQRQTAFMHQGFGRSGTTGALRWAIEALGRFAGRVGLAISPGGSGRLRPRELTVSRPRR